MLFSPQYREVTKTLVYINTAYFLFFSFFDREFRIAQAGSPASSSQLLELQACATMLSYNLFCTHLRLCEHCYLFIIVLNILGTSLGFLLLLFCSVF